MNTVAIDTHKTIQKLVGKGYTEAQAEGLIDALVESDFVTRSYLNEKLKDLENRLTIKALIFLFLHGLLITATISGIVN